jgi:hypothetical protein
MAWVGTLYVDGKYFYVNGKRVASNLVDFFNHCCFFNRPKVLVVFFKMGTANSALIQTKLCRFFKLVVYHQRWPFTYLHQKKGSYAWSVALGVMLSAIGWWGMVANENLVLNNTSTALPMKQPIKMKDIASACGVPNCINQLGVFPNGIMVELYANNGGLAGCYEYKKGGFLCLNHQLLLE